MRLGIICNPYHRGGITRWIADFAGAWTRAGGTCWFVVPRPRRPFVNGAGRPAMIELLEALPPGERPTIVAPEVGGEFEFGTEGYRAAVYRDAALRSIPAGVPVTVTDDPAAWRAAAALADRNPFIGALHGDEEHYYGLARRHAGSLAALACVSRRIARRASTIPGIEGTPAAVIPCGTRAAGAAPPRSGDGPLRLLWVGRMIEWQKRVSDLPRLAAALLADGLDFELTLAGDGEDRDAVERLARDLGVESRLRFLGWQPADAVESLLRQADLLVQPSNLEGMSVAVMEALGAGRGVVASRVSGVEDYEGHPLADGCLWIHPVGDVAAVAECVRRAAAVPAAVRGARALALHDAELSLERCVARYAELVARLGPASGRAEASSALHDHLVALASRAVSAQRRARLWLRHRRGGAGRASSGSQAPVTSTGGVT